MVAPNHAPEWPDKILVAAMLVVFAGLLAVAQVLMGLAGASIDEPDVGPLSDLPQGWILVTGGLTVVVGAFAYHHQSWMLTTLGVLTGAASFGMFGASSLLSALALWPLIRSFQEGEETHLDRHRVRGHEWPDKAIIASVLLACGGAVTLIQAALLVADRLAAPVLPGRPMLWAAISGAAAFMALVGARNAFHVRRAWTCWTGAALLFVAAGFYFVGPALAIASAALLGLAYKDAEFLLHAPQDHDVDVT